MLPEGAVHLKNGGNREGAGAFVRLAQVVARSWASNRPVRITPTPPPRCRYVADDGGLFRLRPQRHGRRAAARTIKARLSPLRPINCDVRPDNSFATPRCARQHSRFRSPILSAGLLGPLSLSPRRGLSPPDIPGMPREESHGRARSFYLLRRWGSLQRGDDRHPLTEKEGERGILHDAGIAQSRRSTIGQTRAASSGHGDSTARIVFGPQGRLINTMRTST